MLRATGRQSEEELAWEGALVCRMNAIYYSRRIRFWQRWEVAFRLVAAVASSAAIATVLKNVDGLSIALSIVAALTNISSQVFVPAEKLRALGSLLSSYIDLYHRFAHIYQFNGTEADLRDALKSLGEVELAEVKYHPAPSDKERNKAQDDVAREIGAQPVPTA